MRFCIAAMAAFWWLLSSSSLRWALDGVSATSQAAKTENKGDTWKLKDTP